MSIFKIPKGLSKEELKMLLDPLGYDPIIDIDEINLRHRRKTDDPYLKATIEGKRLEKKESEDYRRWKNNPAERR